MIEISDFRSGFFLGPKKNKDETEEKQEIVCLINFESLVTKGKKKETALLKSYICSVSHRMAKFIVGKSALYNISPLHQDRRFAKDSKTVPHFIKPRKPM